MPYCPHLQPGTPSSRDVPPLHLPSVPHAFLTLSPPKHLCCSFSAPCCVLYDPVATALAIVKFTTSRFNAEHARNFSAFSGNCFRQELFANLVTTLGRKVCRFARASPEKSNCSNARISSLHPASSTRCPMWARWCDARVSGADRARLDAVWFLPTLPREAWVLQRFQRAALRLSAQSSQVHASF